MSFLSPPKPFLETGSWNRAQANALRYNTSQAGSVIPLIYGTTRQQVQLIGFGNYRGPSGKKGKNGPLPVQGAHVGKGGGSAGKKGPTGKKSKDYSVDVDFCICQGPVTIGEKNWVWSSAGEEFFTSTASQGLVLYNGDDGQAADPTFVGIGQIVGYSGTCHITGTPLDLGQSPVIPNLSFEVNGFEYTTGGSGYAVDANPANVISDFLTNDRYGAGWPAANLDPDILTTYGYYCQASQLVISVALQVQTEAAAWIAEIAKLTNSAIVWSGSILKFVPYGDIEITGNGATFTPDLTVQYTVDDDSYLPWRPHLDTADPEVGEDDPVIVVRTNPADAINWVSIEYWDRSNFYNNTVIAQFDQGSIDLYGLRTEPSIQGNCFTSSYPASVSARLILQRKLYIRNTFRFQLGWQYALLEPMDIIALTDTRAGLSQQPVRITAIEENENGDLIIEAEEVVSGEAPAPSPPGPQNGAVSLSGGTWMNATSTPLTGSSDSSLGTFSIWIAPTTSSPQTTRGLFRAVGPSGAHSYVAVTYVDSTGIIQLYVADDSGNFLIANSNASLLVFDDRFHHLAISWDVSAYPPSGIIPTSTIQLYFDGNPISMVVSSRSGLGLTIPYSSMATPGWKIWSADGALPFGQDFHGCVQDFWFDQGTQLDFSDPTVLAKFRTVGNRATFLGDDGSLPTGSPPSIFLHADITSTASDYELSTNRGSGGALGGFTTSYPSICGTDPYS